MCFDQFEIARLLDDASAATTTDGQGKAYEALAEYLFLLVPGCIVERNITNMFRTEQVDLAVGNPRLPDGLPILPTAILIECKDWRYPVDSKSVGYFMNVLSGRGISLGILIAAKGITGDLLDMTNAHALGLSAAPRGVKVVVITTADIARLGSTAGFCELLTRRYLRAIATGTIGAPEEI